MSSVPAPRDVTSGKERCYGGGRARRPGGCAGDPPRPGPGGEWRRRPGGAQPCPAGTGGPSPGCALRRSARSATAVSWRAARWPARRPRRPGCPGASWLCRPS